MDEVLELRRLQKDGDAFALKERLDECDLAALRSSWREFKPLEKLVLFKLLTPVRALELYAGLDAGAKYFLLCAFDLNSIAPLLEDLPPRTRSLFRQLSFSYYDRMLRLLAAQQVEIPVRTN